MKTLKFLPLLAAATLLAPGGLLAQTTRTWDRGASTDVLTTAANWSGDVVPASTGATAGTRQDASFDGSVAGTLNLTYGAAFGGIFGVGLVMTAGQTSALNIANSAGTAQTLRIVNSTAATVGGIQLASGAGALTIGAAGTNNPITLALGQGSTALNYYFANNSANTATIEENVTISKGGNHTATLIFDGTGSWNVKGVVGALSGTAGAGNVSIFGGSAVTLSGNNTYAGGTDIDNGTVVVKHANALGTGTINLSADATNEVARLQSDGTARTWTNAVTFGGTDGGAMNYLGGAGTGDLTFSGGVNWGSGTKTTTIDSSKVTFSGEWTGASAANINTIAGTDTATSLVILDGNRGTAAKQIDIGDNVTVRANHANSFGSDNTEPLGILGGAAVSVVELTNGITLARTLSLKGRSTETVALRSAGNNSVALSVAAGGTNYNIESTSGNLTISSVGGTADNQRNLFVTGAGNVTLADWAGRNDLTMNGSGTLTMGGTASSLSGTATVNSGTLFLNAVGGVGALSATGGLVIDNNATVVTTGSGNSIGTTTAVTVNTGGLLDMRKNNIIGALAGGGTVRNTTTTDYTLTVNNDGGTSSFGGVIEQGSTGKINLAKNGNGTLTLTGTNTYTGSTTVQAGLLVVNGDSSSAIGRLDVAAGATLGGSGTLGGATTINSGAFHSPGNSPGVQTFTSGLTYSNGSTFVWELTGNTDSGRGTVFDGVNVSGGTLTINGGVTNNLVFNGAGSTVSWSDAFWDSNQQWLVFDNASLPTVSSNVFVTINVGLDSISQSLTSVRSGSSFSWDTIGSDVYLTYAIPEPSTYALLALAAAALGVCVRRRRDNRPSLPALASSRPALHEESSRIMES